VPSLPSNYPSYVLPPVKPTASNYNLSKMSTSIFKDGGGVESIPEGVIRHMKRAAIAARLHKAGGR